MKNFNISKIRDLFAKKDEEFYREHNLLEELSDPFILFNLAIRGVNQYNLLDEVYVNKFPERYGMVRSTIRNKQFNYLFDLLQKVSLEDSDVFFRTTEDLGKELVEDSLSQLMQHFIELEAYEKCSVIKKYLEKV